MEIHECDENGNDIFRTYGCCNVKSEFPTSQLKNKIEKGNYYEVNIETKNQFGNNLRAFSIFFHRAVNRLRVGGYSRGFVPN